MDDDDPIISGRQDKNGRWSVSVDWEQVAILAAIVLVVYYLLTEG